MRGEGSLDGWSVLLHSFQQLLRVARRVVSGEEGGGRRGRGRGRGRGVAVGYTGWCGSEHHNTALAMPSDAHTYSPHVLYTG